jgi:P27 family predicted phage terminase small subunit
MPASDAPAHLAPEAAGEYRRLRELLRDRDQWDAAASGLVEAYCAAYGRFVRAERKIAETAEVIKLPKQEQPSVNLWLRVSQDAQTLMRQIAAQLQLGRSPQPDLGDEPPARPPEDYFPVRRPGQRKH